MPNNTARRIIMDRMGRKENDYRDDREWDRDYGNGYRDGVRDYNDGRDYNGDMRGSSRSNAYQRGYRAGRDHGYEYVVKGDSRDYRDYKSEYDGNYDYNSHNYGGKMQFESKDVKEIDKMLKNSDGTRGFHYDIDQTRDLARRMGIDLQEIGEKPFMVALNMIYSDYCKVAKKMGVDRPEFYGEMARAFLEDDDFDGKPEEKMYTYYMCIMKKDD